MFWKKALVYPSVVLGAATAAVFATATGASAHGYVSAPPSRQALCATKAVPDCGAIQFEPQSVEAPKGGRSCDGGIAAFKALGDNSRNWPARNVGSSLEFTWVFTARHRTSNWEYFIGNTRVGIVNGNNAQPEAVVTHKVNLGNFRGRQTVLAVWNIGDTPMAFYSCVDVNIGGTGPGTGNPPPANPTPTKSPTTAPPGGSPTATVPAPPPGGQQPGAQQPNGSWAPGTAYKVGDVVTFNGQKFKCRQAHTSIRSWEPSVFTLALWLPV
ncbi:lytic polysaccharide monooxygenase [Virgisporangium ochraceum]|uniref:Cellulose-binding protein n=1 Tax=Virgisporangium ochraceum TaxID=65505 RepID=A0A8J3ZUK3_9ACTN|nr:lytic polysaccharide monooxygenase [Virgisporangium ochraceum]GIJ67775.1 cellulose-binding protein [Virgisporangium ochraceum]